jgi:actin-related protein 5
LQFSRAGNSGSIDHPVLLTESALNPNKSRHRTSELLFECYGVPAVSYGVGFMFDMHRAAAQFRGGSGLIVSSSYESTHILPLLNGKPVALL